MTRRANRANPPAMKRIRLFPILLLLPACSPAPADPVAAEVVGPPSPYAFEVQLTLTQRAAEQLMKSSERVIVDAMYWGVPTPVAASSADEIGQIPLGEDAVEVAPGNAVVKVPGAGFDAGRITSVDGGPQVLVNVYSARKTHEDNLLSCGPYEGPLAKAQEKPVAIECDLIDWPEGMAPQ